MLTLDEVNEWIGITAFEVLMHVVALFASSILFCLRWYHVFHLTFWHIFTPLFLASGLNVYFVFIISLRIFVEDKQLRRAMSSNAFNFLRASMVGLFEMFLCQKIEGDFEHGQVAVPTTYGIVFMPVWILMACLAGQVVRLL